MSVVSVCRTRSTHWRKSLESSSIKWRSLSTSTTPTPCLDRTCACQSATSITLNTTSWRGRDNSSSMSAALEAESASLQVLPKGLGTCTCIQVIPKGLGTCACIQVLPKGLGTCACIQVLPEGLGKCWRILIMPLGLDTGESLQVMHNLARYTSLAQRPSDPFFFFFACVSVLCVWLGVKAWTVDANHNDCLCLITPWLMASICCHCHVTRIIVHWLSGSVHRGSVPCLPGPLSARLGSGLGTTVRAWGTIVWTCPWCWTKYVK